MMRKFGLFVTFLVFGWTPGASALPSNNPITAGLIAAYEFSGNADDVSGNSNNGVVNGAVLATSRNGLLSSAYSFDGSSNIVVSNPVGLHSTNTISLWIKLDTIGVGTYHYPIDLGALNNNWIEVLPTGMFRTANRQGPAIDTVQLEVDQWSMLTRTFDGSTLTAYINGQISGFIPDSPNDPTRITIGSSGNGLYGHIGSIDDVYIYDRALSPTEVSTLYSAAPEPSTALLLGIGLSALAVRRENR